MKIAYSAAAIFVFSAVGQAFADDAPPASAPPDQAIELGVGIGKSSLRADAAELDIHGSVNATGYKAFVGYRFDKYITLEAAYMDAGTFTLAAGSDRVDAHPKIEQVSIVGSYPVLPWFAPYVRVGADHWKADLTASDPTLGKVTLSGSATDFAWGAGLEFFVDRALVRIEYEQMRTTQNVDDVLPTDFRHQIILASIVWLL